MPGGFSELDEEQPNDPLEQKNVCPEEKAGLFSRITFAWLNPIIKIGSERYLEQSDLWELGPNNTAQTNSGVFSSYLDEEMHQENKSMVRVLHKSFGRVFYLAGFYKLFNDIGQLVSPVFLNLIIKDCQNLSQSQGMGFVYAVCLALCQLVSTVCVHQYFHIVMTHGMRVRGALSSAVYRKSLRVTNSVRQRMTTGEIVNLMSIDSQKLMDTMTYLHMTWSGVLQISVCLGFLFHYIGVSALTGVVVMIILMPVQTKLGRVIAGIRKQTLKFTDSRVKTMNEILQGIRILKFYAWEEPFLNKLLKIRSEELGKVRSAAKVKAFNSSLMTVSPTLVSVATFAAYAAMGNKLDASTIFTALSFFYLLRFPLMFLPNIWSNIAESKVSIARLGKFLFAEELKKRERRHNEGVPIRVEGADFQWDVPSAEEQEEAKGKDKKKTGKKPAEQEQAKEKEAAPPQPRGPTLSSISFEVPKGSLTMIVGAVGCGKSSLLQGLLGEMATLKGQVELSGSIAYCPQQAWIQNTTLKNNVLFGKPLDESKYEQVVRVCSLERDLQMLPAGDATEIGEKGINLSGGQKQRVSIARAVYFDADIFLLDDVLSAVDAHVGKHIFDECINGVLKNKTRLFVTHQLQYLPHADQVLFMKDGRIVEMGTYGDLMTAGGEFAQLVTKHSHAGAASTTSLDGLEEAAADGQDHATAADTKAKDAKKSADNANGAKKAEKDGGAEEKGKQADKAKLMSVEERATGTVSLKVYKSYVNAAGGPLVFIGVLAIMVSAQSSIVGSNWWLAAWTSNSYGDNATFYILIYLAWAVGTSFISLGRDFFYFYSGLRAARSLHEQAFRRVIRAPMSFFDTTPVGRIINRFSKDQDTIDTSITDTLKAFFNMFGNCVAVFLVITSITPLFVVVLLPLLYFYYRVQAYYRQSSRELKRLDSISRSPLFAHFSETLGGLTTIRAYDVSQRFEEDNMGKVNANQKAYFTQIASQRWLAVRLEFVGMFIVLSASMLAVWSRERISPGIAGMSLSYSLQTTGALTWLVRQFTDTETSMNAVERVSHYANELDNEAPAEVPQSKPADEWPQEGKISFKQVVMRYRPDLDPVLKNVSFDFRPREKVGIIGRTGSGKSTLMITLFRLVEISQGKIEIDDIDVSTIGLNDLRRALAIIPQDPVLFSGTIRSNLDPFDQFTDQEVWAALDKCNLKQYVGDQPLKLAAPVAENGENFSVGQRQLICLGRAILRHTKILVMDEATASVDMETDAFIQRTLRSSFADSTVLTIAHRLNTIMDYDRILVMDAGQVAEFDTPRALLSQPDSILNSMVKETGPTNAQHLRSLVFGSVN